MIDAVSTLSVQASASRASSRNAVSVASRSSLVSEIKFVGSRIRMDNNLDMAIMEFRSVETGDVLRQYPSEPQIRAFQRAASAEARADSAPQYDVVVEAPDTSSAPAATTDTSSGGDSAPVVTTTAAPAPSTTSAAPVETPAPAASTSASGGDSGGSTSVVV